MQLKKCRKNEESNEGVKANAACRLVTPGLQSGDKFSRLATHTARHAVSSEWSYTGIRQANRDWKF